MIVHRLASLCALGVTMQMLASGCLTPAAWAQDASDATPRLAVETSPYKGYTDTKAEPSPLRLISSLGSVPKRVVSLSPAATHILIQLGKAQSVVGRVYVKGLQPDVYNIPLVGTPDAPQMPQILALKPDVVIAHPTQHLALSPVIQQGIPILWLDTASLADTQANIRCLGVLMQAQDKAENLIAEDTRLLEVAAQKTAAIRPQNRPRVLQVLAVDGKTCIVPADNHVANERLRIAGARTPEFGNGDTVRVDAAAVRNFHPQYICTDATQECALRALLATPAWSDVTPEVLVFPPLYIRDPSVNYGMFTLWLASSLQPQLFAQNEHQLQDDAVLSLRPLTLPFSYVGKAHISRERVFDMPAKTLTLQFSSDQKVLSSLHGLCTNVRSIGNHYTPPAGWPVTGILGMPAIDARLARLLGTGKTPPLLLHTGADIDNFAFVEAHSHDLHVGVLVTAGVSSNALRAGADSGNFVEPGTINIIALTNRRLSDAAMTQALISITEAKTAALQTLDIRSTFSGRAATGTGTDAVMIVEGDGSPLTMAGGHTKLGELLTRVTGEAVRKAIARQNSITAQRAVRYRLAEHLVDLTPTAEHLPQERAARVAQHVSALLAEPYYEGFLAAALALADSSAYGTLPNVKAFTAWCLTIASRACGKEITELPQYYGATVPLPLRMALNALAAGTPGETP